MDWIYNTDPSDVVSQWIRFCWYTGPRANSFGELALAEVIIKISALASWYLWQGAD